MKSRRHFIHRCSCALFGAAFLPVVGKAAAASPQTGLVEFMAQLNTPFTMTSSSGQVLTVVLEKAQRMFPKKRPELACDHNFELKFATQTTAVLEHGIHRFSHPVLGVQDIFVVPNHSDQTGLVNCFATFQRAPISAA